MKDTVVLCMFQGCVDRAYSTRDGTRVVVIWQKESVDEPGNVRLATEHGNIVYDDVGIDVIDAARSPIGGVYCFRWRNYYRCDECEISWDDVHSSMCNDRCPECNAEIEPWACEEEEAA